MLHTDGLIVDLFAGGGGTSLGLEWAFGRSPDIAINHDREALAMHMANHPRTLHYHEDVRKVDIRKIVAGRPVAFLWLSPDCKHHSKAKGGKPVDRRIRGLAWEAVRWAEQARPTLICLENVQEFQDWGPLDKNDMPDRSRKGHTFRRWKGRLQALGYVVEVRKLCAANFGAAHRGEHALVAPYLVPRYGERPGQDPRCLSVEDPAPVIVPTQNGGNLVAAFLAKHNGGHEATGTQLNLPANTVTAHSIGLVMVDGEPHFIADIGMRMLVARELFRCQGFPDTYQIDIECDRIVRGRKVRGRLPAEAQVRMCGNSVPPQLSMALAAANAPELVREQGAA